MVRRVQSSFALRPGLPLALADGLLRMTTEVTPTDLRIWFGWVPIYRRVVTIGGIQRIQVVSIGR